MAKVTVRRGGEPLFDYDDESGELNILRSSLSWEDAVSVKDAITRFQKRRDPPKPRGPVRASRAVFLDHNLDFIVDSLNPEDRLHHAGWLLRRFGIRAVVKKGQ